MEQPNEIKVGEMVGSLVTAGKQSAEFIQSFTKSVYGFFEEINKISSKFKEVALKLNNTELAHNILINISAFFDKVNEENKFSIIILAQNGWFISLDMYRCECIEFANMILNDELSEVDAKMMSYFKAHSCLILESLGKSFPNRLDVLNDAFEAHNNGKFNLSIPIFLSQSDGICAEITNFPLYGTRNGFPHTKKYIDNLQCNSFMSAILEPFKTDIVLPINANQFKRKSLTIDDYLNRHTILHGEDCDYGTEINSLKAISLINFVASVLVRQAHKEIDTQNDQADV
jgi:hypothetical protein